MCAQEFPSSAKSGDHKGKVTRWGNCLITSGFQPLAPGQGLLGGQPKGWALRQVDSASLVDLGSETAADPTALFCQRQLSSCLVAVVGWNPGVLTLGPHSHPNTAL